MTRRPVARTRPLKLSRVKHPRFMLFFAVLVIGTAAAAFLPVTPFKPEFAPLLGFDLAALLFLLSALPLWRADGAPAIRARAARDDGGRSLLLAISVVTLGAVLVALGVEIARKAVLTGPGFVLVIATLVLSWLFVNLVYSFHYAHLYYDQTAAAGSTKMADRGGLDFPGKVPPVFADFCYFSFVVGMTCQVSDVVITLSTFRRAVLIHGLLSFFFNLGVLALTINVLSGLL